MSGIQPEDIDSAARWTQHIQHAADRGCLSRAIGTKKAKDFATLHLKGDVAYGMHRRLASIRFDQVRDINSHRRHDLRPFGGLPHTIYRPREKGSQRVSTLP